MNKRLLLLSILIISLSGLLKAQQFKGGVLAGICGTEISHDKRWGPNKMGMYVGSFIELDISERSSLHMELDFIQKGARKNPDTLDPTSYILRLNYLEMPIHYRYDINETWDFEAGLSYGVLIYEYEEENYFEILHPAEEFRKGDFSINFGFYYRLTDHMKLNIRYSNSIFYVRPFPDNIKYWIFDGQTNEVLSFTLHYSIK
ncbi:MAG: PorT family protein [Bacteroidales bacterium]|nr:PorT family protein [Bacteroidales bacterium]